MKTCILDTSVAMAWYLPEAFSAAARHWQKALVEGRVDFIVPSLHFWEMASVLRTYVRRGELEESLATDIYRLHLQSQLTVRDPDRNLVLETALRYEATAYDAVYIELSLEQEAPLLTAGKSTTPWVVRLKDRVTLVHA